LTVPSDDGTTEIVGEFVTVNVTAMTCGLAAPGEVSVTCPEYTPGTRLAPFAVTVNVAGVVALLGLTDNQLPPWLAVTLVAKVIAAPTLLTDTVCGFGAGPPADWVNDNEVCETDSVAVGVTTRVTTIASGLFATFAGLVAVSVTVPV
jgi:hypothetical protein